MVLWKWIKRLVLGLLSVIVAAVLFIWGASAWQLNKTYEPEIRPALTLPDDPESIQEGQRLADLLGRQELGLINQHAGHAVAELRPLRSERLQRRSQILAGREQQISPTRHTETRHNLIIAFGIHRRFHQHDALVALLVVVGHLQHGGALAAVHGAVTEKEFTHFNQPTCCWLFSNSCVP